MKLIRLYSTVNYSGFLFGDLRKNIPQIVAGLVSKNIIAVKLDVYIGDVYVDSQEQVQNYAEISVDLETLDTELLHIKEYKVNSSMKKPIAYYADLATAKVFIQALNKKVQYEQANWTGNQRT